MLLEVKVSMVLTDGPWSNLHHTGTSCFAATLHALPLFDIVHRN